MWNQTREFKKKKSYYSYQKGHQNIKSQTTRRILNINMIMSKPQKYSVNETYNQILLLILVMNNQVLTQTHSLTS